MKHGNTNLNTIACVSVSKSFVNFGSSQILLADRMKANEMVSHIARMGKREISTEFWRGKLKDE